MLRKILEDFKRGAISIDEAEKKIKLFELSRVADFGLLDLARDNRAGVPEVVFGEGKSREQIVKIAEEMLSRTGRCIITRLSQEATSELSERFKGYRVETYQEAGMVVIKSKDFRLSQGGKVAVLSAGTSDIRVAKEAEVIAREMGCRVYTYYDIGVAGIHRLFPAIKYIVEKDVDVAVVAAGMEGALPSVVAGLLDIPVIGLPVSTGYGIKGRGKAALYAMLQSCSPGIAVVNIDNGFGAGVLAGIIANRVQKFRAFQEPASESP